MLSPVSSLSRCLAYHDIQTLTTSQFKNIIIDNIDICVWMTHFSNWDNLLRVIICPDVIRFMVPELSSVISSVEDLSRDCFYKIHAKRLFFNETTRVMAARGNPTHVYKLFVLVCVTRNF